MSVTGPDETVLQYQHPPKHDEEAHRFRTSQLNHRREEVVRALDLLLPVETTSGQTEAVNLWRDSYNQGTLSPRDDLIKEQSPLDLLRERLDRDCVILAGHSFGACTAIYVAQTDDRIDRVLALDPWLFPLPHDWTVQRTLSTLVICSETFRWPGNQEAIRDLLSKLHTNGASWLAQMTVMKSGHMDQSDMSIMLPAWLAARFRDPELMAPQEVLSLNTRLVEEFVRTGRVTLHDERIRIDQELINS